jgi:porphobilinogen synthase
MNAAAFPHRRWRRPRRLGFSRRLLQENTLTVNDLIYPVFVQEGFAEATAIAAMPGQYRFSEAGMLALAEECLTLGIPALALFPAIAPERKTADGAEALNPEGLVPRLIRRLKAEFPELGLIADVALDPYTSHGQDGLIDSEGYVLNDETLVVLAKQAQVLAEAGADIVAPSDMMDGRIGFIRQHLDAKGLIHCQILAYAAKYASAFYGPFREAVGSAKALQGDKKTYQMDPSNRLEALREAASDWAEGADYLMVKPGLPYLDIISLLQQELKAPIFAYQVSGEYSMIKAAAGWLDGQAVMWESLLSLKRAGATAILTYFAKEAAALLQKNKHF